jgi:GNAT superfamily N-acetyltransferase
MRIRNARPEDAPAIGRIHVDSWRTSYKGIVPDDYLASLSYQRHENNWRQILSQFSHRNFIVVAENEQDELAGFASSGAKREGPQAYAGEVYAIYILQPYQKQGIGRKLLAASAQRLIENEMASMLLWVLADNPARGFYEHLGGQWLEEKSIEIGGVALLEVAYGWPDVRTLLSDAKSERG